MSGPDTIPQPLDNRLFTHPTGVYEAAEQLLPARTWKENPLLWIGLVVAVFMAVPFLASWATRDAAVTPSQPRVQAASAAAAPPAVAVTLPEPAAPVPQRSLAALNSDAPLSVPAPAEASRQMITKCVEKGRVVYTQTGACAGSVSAVPIDTGKNVVGPDAGKAATAPGGGATR